MITFHGDAIVGPELCRILYQTVPEEHHTPIVFDTRKLAPTWGNERRALGEYYPDGHIQIHTNKIIDRVESPFTPNHAGYAAALWYELLDTCYHEFGHHAHRGEKSRQPGYQRYDERRHRWKERFAEHWSERRLAELRDRDPRLGQPQHLTGYLGVRFDRTMDRWSDLYRSGIGVNTAYIKEVRARRSGGQLAVGDVLRRFGLDPARQPGAYALLREASDGLGVTYTDAAGRRHQMYRWGDLPTLGTRLTALTRDRLHRLPAELELSPELVDVLAAHERRIRVTVHSLRALTRVGGIDPAEIADVRDAITQPFRGDEYTFWCPTCGATESSTPGWGKIEANGAAGLLRPFTLRSGGFEVLPDGIDAIEFPLCGRCRPQGTTPRGYLRSAATTIRCVLDRIADALCRIDPSVLGPIPPSLDRCPHCGVLCVPGPICRTCSADDSDRLLGAA